MADTEPYTTKPKTVNPLPPPNPTKFHTQFLFKAIIVSIFLISLTFFPSRAPEFINQTRSWELLQLLFVGIAVSYGLFCKRNDDETEKDQSSKLDTAQSYVSRLLQVSSVFDEERENPAGVDESKVQTWSSQYYRDEPMVVVAQQSSVLEEEEEEKEKISEFVETPLLLPIRSLKTHVFESDPIGSTQGSSVEIRNVSKSGSKRFSGDSSKSRNSSEFGTKRLSGDSNKSINEDFGGGSLAGSYESGSKRFYGDSSKSSNTEFGGASLGRSPESGSKRFSGDSNKTRNGEFGGASLSGSSESSSKRFPGNSNKSGNVEFRSSETAPKRFSGDSNKFRNGEFGKVGPMDLEEKMEGNENNVVLRSPIPWRSRSGRMESMNDLESEFPSFRSQSFRSSKPISTSPPKILSPSHSFSSEMQPKTVADSVRRKSYHKSSPPPPPPPPPPPLPPRPFLSKSPLQNTREFAEKVVVEADEDSESEEEEFEENPKNDHQVESKNVGDGGGGGPDVDKKADEFIAKFREQIRLQRIASIRRSTEQLPRKG